MAAKDFYQLTAEDKQTIYVQIGIKLNIHPAAVEKDWWVVQTLCLFQNMEVAPHIVFKGGTSLSKAWNIIERFSEDIDLALDNQSLYNEIINHRSVYTKIATADYNLHRPKTLNPIPHDKILGDWEKDYKAMQEAMIYGESLPFDQLIERIKELKLRINGINWSG